MNWQDYLAMSVVAVAAIYVAARTYRALFGAAKAGCGSGCGSCGATSNAASDPKQLLTIGAASGEHQAK